MAKKKFYVGDKTFPSENKAYEHVRALRDEYNSGDGESTVNVYIEEGGRKFLYEDVDFRNW